MLTQSLKALHVLASALFVGDIVVSLAWMTCAARAREPRLLAFAGGMLARTDRWLLRPAVLTLVLTGNAFGLLRSAAVWTDPFRAVAVILFVLSGAVWIAFLVPVQKRQIAAAARLASGETVAQELEELAWRWVSAGRAAVGLGVAALVLMAIG